MSWVKRRVSIGRLWTSCVRIVELTFDCVVSMMGAAPATVTFSAIAATPKVRSMVIVAVTGSATASRVTVENPVNEALILYVPGSSPGKLYNPSPLVTASREMPLFAFVAVTVAPGITAAA